MAAAAFGNMPGVEIDDREIVRTRAHAKPAWTIDSVEELRAEHPGQRPVLLIGADHAATFTTWHRWRELLDQADLLVAARSTEFDAGLALLALREAAPDSSISRLFMPTIDASSSEIRDLLAAGQIQAAEALVPTGVRPLLASLAKS
jgi:nicotinate-nucleotide adenylyltransferase